MRGPSVGGQEGRLSPGGWGLTALPSGASSVPGACTQPRGSLHPERHEEPEAQGGNLEVNFLRWQKGPFKVVTSGCPKFVPQILTAPETPLWRLLSLAKASPRGSFFPSVQRAQSPFSPSRAAGGENEMAQPCPQPSVWSPMSALWGPHRGPPAGNCHVFTAQGPLPVPCHLMSSDELDRALAASCDVCGAHIQALQRCRRPQLLHPRSPGAGVTGDGGE